MKFALLNVLRQAYLKHETPFVNNLSIFEHQIEKHYAHKKKTCMDGKYNPKLQCTKMVKALSGLYKMSWMSNLQSEYCGYTILKS